MGVNVLVGIGVLVGVREGVLEGVRDGMGVFVALGSLCFVRVGGSGVQVIKCLVGVITALAVSEGAAEGVTG